jgi:diguanylate cyclase (GGDEF)-like protein/PAS domain S-box-containing protein
LAKSRGKFTCGLPPSIVAFCDQLADSTYIMDSAGVIRYANRAFEKLTGYKAEEIVGASASILASGAHPDAVFDNMWETLREGRPFRFVFTSRKKDGSHFEEGVMVSPIHDAATDEDYFVHMARLIKYTRQSYDVFTLLANSAPAGIYLQRDGALYFVNDRLSALLGRSAGELVGSNWLDLIAEEDRKSVLSHVAGARQQEPTPPFECRVETPQGDRWVMASVQPIVLVGPEAVSGDFTAGYVVDITARKLAEERLRDAISIQSATIESTTDGIVVVNQAREIVTFNQRFTEMWNIDDLPKMGAQRAREVLARQMKDAAAFRHGVEATWTDPWIEETGRVELRDGRHLEYYSKPQVVDGVVSGRVWSWRDVTERNRFEAALMRLANYDSLTGLMNRRKIQEELENSLANSDRARGALLLLDLDGFKEVNDTFGHQAGDEVLVQVARVLADSDLGELIGRFGGDEFAILLPGVTPSQATRAAKHALHRLSEHNYLAAGGHVSLTGSMGVACYPGHATTSDELLTAADLALYEAKSDQSGNLRSYSPSLKRQSQLQSRGDWQVQLRDAISRGRGKLYTEKTLPLRSSADPTIYRLTMRMTGSRSQILSSREIGSLAQQASLLLALDRWLLREATALARRPSFISTAAGLSFELSAHPLTHPDVIRRLLDLAALRAAHGSPLIIEMTGLEAAAGVEASIATLREAGYRFEIPDCDNASLARILSTLPVDFLKLSPSLVEDLTSSLSVRALVEGTIETARKIGASVLAENVSDARTLAVLKTLGVDYARGPAVGAARSANAVFRTPTRRLRAA